MEIACWLNRKMQLRQNCSIFLAFWGVPFVFHYQATKYMFVAGVLIPAKARALNVKCPCPLWASWRAILLTYPSSARVREEDADLEKFRAQSGRLRTGGGGRGSQIGSPKSVAFIGSLCFKGHARAARGDPPGISPEMLWGLQLRAW